ncbi:GntR family transcriptional regulator [Alkalilimnicola sp. S0819]|uniref:GntR family transcriptional regulator n=1 Tax=Alkalilimnicola sp. S0819 TaxID=2613922 RepID=UPI00126227DD|nr:GntR family transcriptional regulator [Alkalilimnicola sp. S0819]KAB7622800.1 GntR family transcriptional regulator [Alkalilimnicola sp. S0819]MPQ17296.1 FCD domain-containing protein [Alkalilimnicola sp. S0819]
MQLEAPKPLPELVYDAVLNAICEGTLRPGERLTQETVAERLNVSRLPVGQALAKLKGDGFVVEAGRRGLKVAPINAVLVRELYEVRAGLDLISAGKAARRITPALAGEGEELLADGLAAAKAGDVLLLIDADWRFHWLIHEIAGNERLRDLMRAQWHHLRRIMINITRDTSDAGPAWAEHRAIWEAVCAGDAIRAERLARAHAHQASERLQQRLASESTLQQRTA